MGDGRAAAADADPRARKPVITAVDDDPHVLAVVARDLRRQYGARFRIVRAPDGETGLSALEELALAADPVALIISDQRMPGLSGVELLSRSRKLHPDARRVLLTAYADTDAAIAAINEVHLDQYVLKPWDPPEERLFPTLDELLDDWEAGFHPPFDGIRIVGHRWSPDAHRLRDFLSRNLIPFKWVDIERDAEEAEVLRDASQTTELPLVVFADGHHAIAPSNRVLAESVGFHATTTNESFDLVVVGAGPAGLAAAVYGSSEGLRTAVLETQAPGGQAGSSSRIENYLGFPNGLSGGDLARRALDQAKRLGAEILCPVTATSITRRDPYRLIELDHGATLATTAIIVATGVKYRALDVAGADALRDAGVFYGAAAHDARAYEGESVVIVGAANSAGQAALHFARFAATVTMLVRGESLAARTSAYLVDQIDRTDNIVVRLCSEVAAVKGDARLEQVDVVDRDGTRETLAASGMFIFIGAEPSTGWLGNAIARDTAGFLLAGTDLASTRLWKAQRQPFSLETSLPGVFAAGDVRARSLKRVASAVGDGSIAVHYVHQYLGL